MKPRKLISILLLLLVMTGCHSNRQRKEIAVLVPYSSMTQIWQSFTGSAMEEFSDTLRYNLHFYQTANWVADVISANSYAYDSRPIIQRTFDRIRRERLEPDLIITYGDYLSHGVAGLDDPILKDIPVLCVDVVHPRWQDLLASRPNFVVMESKPEVRKNLEFITAMGFPNYVVTVMDSTYIDDHIRDHILEQIGNDPEHYRPNLHLEQIDRIQSPRRREPQTTLFPISIMHPQKNDPRPWVQGGFELDWIFYTDQQGTSFLNIKEDVYSNSAMQYNIGQYFTMTPEYFNLPLINSMNTCIGGYFTPYPSMWKQVHPIVDKLLSGTPPRMIPWGVLEKDYWLDWRLVKSMHPYASDFPKGVKFVNLPFRQRSRLMYWSLPLLVTVLIILFIVYAIIIPSVMSVRQKRQRKLLLEKAREAEKSEKQVDDILSEIGAYMWSMLPDGTVRYSSLFYRDFGIPEDTVLQSERMLKYIHEPGRSKLRELMMSDDFEGEVEMEVMVDIPRSDATRAVLTHTISLTRAEGENDPDIPLKAGIFYFNDEVHNRNEELRRAYNRSEEVAEKESFLASMSAGFKAPLNKIVGFSRSLALQFNTLTDAQKEHYGQMVMEANAQMMELLDEVMGDTRRSRDEEHRLSRMNVSELMEEIYANLWDKISDKFRFDFRPGPSQCEIMVNRPVFLQIMDALLNDAFNCGRGDVAMGWRQEEESIVIYVENTGSDISKYSKMAESIGAGINMVETPGKPVRIEMTFHVTPPIRKWAEEL
ncbi:MAG: sensor histidine kinase [Candidatus Cryptobacteroides sp.]